MYKVLIVDDELIVRVGLKSIVDWESHGFVVVGEASNGEEALALCESLQPDLILTDIKMPKMDGLTFVKEAAERWSHLKIIILSAWNEFELLQQAIRYGVKDYVMKMSFNPEELAAILHRMRTQLDQQHWANTDQSRIQLSKSNVGLALKESFFRRALRDQLLILKPDPDVLLKTGRTTKQTIYLIGGDRSFASTTQSPKLQGHLLKYAAINIVDEVLARDLAADVVEVEEELYVALVDLPDLPHLSDQENETLLKVLAQDIQQSLLMFLNYSVSIGISHSGDSYASFYPLYQQSMKALRLKYFTGHQSIHTYNHEACSEPLQSQPLLTPDEEKQLNEELEQFRFSIARERVVEVIDKVRHDRSKEPRELIVVFSELFHPWFKMYKKYESVLSKETAQPSNSLLVLESIDCLDEIEKWFMEYSIELEEQLRSHVKGMRTRDEIENAKKYVDAHYSSEISIVSIAKHVGLNSTYFSHLFKKETGEGFSEYLTRIRLTQAQRLLRESSKPISEVAEKAGYRDVAYFRKIFRQHYSMSPTEFRSESH